MGIFFSSKRKRKGKADLAAKRESPLKAFFEARMKDVAAIRERLKDVASTNYALAHLHLRRGNFFDARIRFRLVLRWRPEHGDAPFYLARTGLRSGRDKCREEAREIAARLARDGSPRKEEAEYLLASAEEVASVPFRLICDAEQNAAEYRQDVLPLYLRIDALRVPEAAEDGEEAVAKGGSETALSYSRLLEREYAAHLVNALTERCSIDPSARVLVVGDRYGETVRYLREKGGGLRVVHAALPAFIPPMPGLEYPAEEGERKAPAPDMVLSSLADERLRGLGPFDVLVLPYLAFYYRDSCAPAAALSDCLTERALVAFGALAASDGAEAAEFFPEADVFARAEGGLRESMSAAGREYINLRGFSSQGRDMRRLLAAFRVK